MEILTLIIAFLLLAFVAVVAYFMGRYIATKGMVVLSESELNELIKNEREDAVKRSRSVLGGQFSEQLAPYLPDFKYKPTEVRFIGKPIDFIVFKGMDDKNIEEIVFVEVKSGKAQLSAVERKLKRTIEDRRIKWEEYRIPKGITNSPD